MTTHAEYQRYHRSKMTDAEKQKAKKRDNEYKKMKRRTDPEWLAKERARRRKYGKHRTGRGDSILHARKYRSNPLNVLKEKARAVVHAHLLNGRIIRPERCDECNKIPKKFKGNRSPLRADHYKGYEKENWLKIKWICVDCDGEQLRSKQPLVIDK